MKYLLAFILLHCAVPAKATEIATIPEGITSFDIDGDGTKEIIIKAWQSNFNAHGFYVISVYKNLEKRFLIVPNKKESNFKTRHAKECALKDYYALRKKGKVSIIEIETKGSQTRFTKFKMFESKKAFSGRAPWFFEPIQTLTKSKKYCDFSVALEENKNLL